MRYEKAENLLLLAPEMQAARGGLSLDDIKEKYGVSKRTAMRMKDAILRLFPHADEVPTDERKKRWRIPPGTLDRFAGCSADELANLETAINVLRREHMADQANALEGLSAKIKAVLRPEIARRIEPDLEALIEAENLAFRPGPKPKTRVMVLDELRRAIKGFQVVTIKYYTRSRDTTRQRKVHPYGFIFGHRHYLVAKNHRRDDEGFRTFSLPNISKVEVMDENFEWDESFDLENYTKQAFGIYHEEPFDVVWKFSPRAAKDAKYFKFHPDQTEERLKNGSLIVRFRAGGALEMCWYLFSWGKDVEVLEPQSLADMLRDHRPKWPGLP